MLEPFSLAFPPWLSITQGRTVFRTGATLLENLQVKDQFTPRCIDVTGLVAIQPTTLIIGHSFSLFLVCLSFAKWLYVLNWSMLFQRHVWAQQSPALFSCSFLRMDILSLDLSLHLLGTISWHSQRTDVGVLAQSQEPSCIKLVPQKCLFPHIRVPTDKPLPSVGVCSVALGQNACTYCTAVTGSLPRLNNNGPAEDSFLYHSPESSYFIFIQKPFNQPGQPVVRHPCPHSVLKAFWALPWAQILFLNTLLYLYLVCLPHPTTRRSSDLFGPVTSSN